MTRRVVITGVGAVTPLGVGAERLFERWAAGESGISDGVGRCTEFGGDYLSPAQSRRLDRFSQLGMKAADEALEQAQSHGGPLGGDRVGCVIGTGIGGLGTIESQHDVLNARGPHRVSPCGVPAMMPNAAAGNIALRHQLRGPAFGVVSACAAGADAIGTALRLIRAGGADAVVAGGTESALTPLSLAAFGVMQATSPTGVSRPFDARRDGFVMGEGAGMLVLESAESAAARGARPLGEVLGFGSSADAFHVTAPDPSGLGAARAIESALQDAGVGPEQLSYINAHGTATELNDRSETVALKVALGEAAWEVPVSSTKSAIGHLLGAAGAVEAVVTLLSLREGVAPPTLNYEQQEEGLDLDYVPGHARSLNGKRADNGMRVGISNSFGFGGHNAVVCIGVGV